jgi:hypothetical protein
MLKILGIDSVMLGVIILSKQKHTLPVRQSVFLKEEDGKLVCMDDAQACF